MAGILTKTVVRSPVIRWILQAQIRNRHCNDVAFVGDDFIHLKQVKDQGYLEHVATKANFDARIRAAKTFTIEPIVEDEDSFMKIEDDGRSQGVSLTPPQCLLLTTDNNELLFVCLLPNEMGGYSFVHQSCPLPTFDRMLFQPGEHLAVDPNNRAFAVAANEREVIIYSSKSNQEIAAELRSTSRKWSPVAAQRPLQVDGVIQHMDFLPPPSDDEDRIILLVILVERRRTRAVWIEWRVDTDVYQAQIHSGQPLDVGKGLPSLLIPLCNASFFLVTGTEVKRWSNILCGCATASDVPLIKVKPLSAGDSPRRPLWVNWCRPRRSLSARDNTDHLYLAREDGVVVLVQAGGSVESSHAGDLQCHVGSAFASLGDERDPDILVATGDMSSGRTYSIGHWPTPIRVPDMNRPDTMVMNLVQTIPNWATVTDMVTTTLPGKSQRSRDGIFITSGRQPYGAVTELRQGLEARLSAYFELEGLRTITNMWVLPMAGLGSMLLVLSSPTGTRFITLDAEMQEIDEANSAALALDSENPTLAAAFTIGGKLVQITRSSVRVSPGIVSNFEDAVRIDCEKGSSILTASIDAGCSVAVTANRKGEPDGGFELVLHPLAMVNADAMDEGMSQSTRTTLDSEPLATALLDYSNITVVFVFLSNGNLHAYSINRSGDVVFRSEARPPASSDEACLCDSLAVICPRTGQNDSLRSLAVLCGLRDGRLYMAQFSPEEGLQDARSRIYNFGQSAVKLIQHPDNMSAVYAMSGLDFCLLTLDSSAISLRIQNIWITDKMRPQLAQNAVVACTHLPQAHLLASAELAGCLAMVSDDEFLVGVLDHADAPVPRQIPVSGTPNRLIYVEQQRSLVCASMQSDVEYFPSAYPQSKPEERRQVWPVIDFIPSNGSEPTFSYQMQPGERVFALLEWSFKPNGDKTYSFILIGGSYVKSNGSVRGRITFVQPTTKTKNKDWMVVDVKEGTSTKFEAPVYSLALLDEITYIACTGKQVVVSRFSVADTKWEQICTPFKLPSPGMFITVEGQQSITISTVEDGLVNLTLREGGRNGSLTSSYKLELVRATWAPRADPLLSHAYAKDGAEVLSTTKFGQILALQHPSDGLDNGSSSENMALVLHAQLSRSLTRIRRSNIRPPWKSALPECLDLQNQSLIGCAPDGTLVGLISLNNPDIVRRLSWLQRLCEWSQDISLHTYHRPPFSPDSRASVKSERAIPVGLCSKGQSQNSDMIVLGSNRSELQDNHIDGDILQRLLDNGGADCLRKMLAEVADRHDRVGEWVRQHLDEELQAIDEVIDIVTRVLDLWI